MAVETKIEFLSSLHLRRITLILFPALFKTFGLSLVLLSVISHYFYY